jgi:hypothetical protein
MDFIERWFGLSPDGGNGTFEASLIFAGALIVVGLIFRRRLVDFARQVLGHRRGPTE